MSEDRVGVAYDKLRGYWRLEGFGNLLGILTDTAIAGSDVAKGIAKALLSRVAVTAAAS